MHLRAEVISIGDELTSGNRLDTNSQWLSQKLGEIGIQTAFHTTVGDCMQDNIRVFQQAAERADIVIASGGLGPTADDLTREAIASAFDLTLELRDEALQHIEQLFSKRNRPMPERNRSQAMFPRSARIVPNPHGTAPGIDLMLEQPKCRIFALPGVPAEMKQMYCETVETTLVQEMGAGKKRWYYKSLKVFGIGESDVEKLLPDLIQRDRDPLVGITVSQATITLRIAALCSSEQEFAEKIVDTENTIHEKLGLLVYGEGEIDLDQAVFNMLVAQGKKLGVVEVGAGCWIAPLLAKHTPSIVGVDNPPESLSGGILSAHWIPSMASSDLPNGLVARAEEFVRQEPIDLCLAVGVYPSKHEVESAVLLPTSEFQMVLARRGKETRCHCISLGGHPEVFYHRLAKTGLNFLRTELLANG